MRLSLWEILLRTKEGPIVEEKQFDLSIFKKVQELQKKYDIRYDPEKPLDTDGDLADRVYQAGVELFLDLGTYCTTTRRVVKLTERELQAEIASCSDEVEMGQGEDRVRIVHRDVEGDQEPIVIAGIQTTPFSDEEMMFRITKGCAADRCIDGIWGGFLLKIEGKYDVIADTPTEIYQYRKAVEIMRKAISAAGRPGMIIINNAPTSLATIAMYSEESGLRRTDGIESTGISELKVAYDDLNRSAFGLVNGMNIRGAHSSVIGGFSGPPEGAAIVAVAASLQLVAIQKANLFRCGVVEALVKSRVTRKELWAAGTAIQGVNRNTKLIVDGSIGDHPAAGPGTKQYFYESAAGHIVSTVMGAHSTAGTRKFVVGNICNYGTPLESRWMGEVCKGAVGMDRATADRLVRYLLTKYENRLKDAPEGETFEKLYDGEKLEPLPHYRKLYEEVKGELRDQGLNFRD
ncbi:MAG: monomethylamine:corrinoid methyltransferase [Deltaproteobacteria bacterium]|nr:monomethylamine:corrinoid methyltransferase [Deltaproteobacteria bacterium]